MISFKEFLKEWSYTAPAVDKKLVAQGYKLLGSGADQFAYSEPGTGHVLKIFGTQKNQKGYTKDHKMFKMWVEYCEKNSSNPFLPKFYGWEGFELEGQSYLQIRMEKLKNLPLHLSQALHELAAYIDRSPEARIKNFIDNIQDLNDNSKQKNLGSYFSANEIHEIEQLVVLLGGDKFKLLLTTISQLSKIAKANNYHFDLHGGNFMHRNDGTPIIVDPWVI